MMEKKKNQLIRKPSQIQPTMINSVPTGCSNESLHKLHYHKVKEQKFSFFHSTFHNCLYLEEIQGYTWVILHHDRRHSPVSRVVGVIALSVGVTMHVGHVALVLC